MTLTCTQNTEKIFYHERDFPATVSNEFMKNQPRNWARAQHAPTDHTRHGWELFDTCSIPPSRPPRWPSGKASASRSRVRIPLAAGLFRGRVIPSYLILSYLSRCLADRWCITVDFTTSFLHSSRFSAFRSMMFHSRPVHSLMLSSHRFLCLGHTTDSKIGTPVATLTGAWRYRVSAGTGRPGVSILWLGEAESLICNFYLSVAAHRIVWADPSQRYTSILLGR